MNAAGRPVQAVEVVLKPKDLLPDRTAGGKNPVATNGAADVVQKGESQFRRLYEAVSLI